MSHYILVDVFTDKPLAGNQLAVVLDAKDIPVKLMQRIAREMNFSETTFVVPPEDPAHAARVRIFTPHTELPFAGHPTIGTAWVLADEGLVPKDGNQFTLEENVGPVDETVWGFPDSRRRDRSDRAPKVRAWNGPREGALLGQVST